MVLFVVSVSESDVVGMKFVKDVFVGMCGGVMVMLLGYLFDTVKVLL